MQTHFYHRINDALDSHVTCLERYALRLDGAGEDWQRQAWIKVPPRMLTSDRRVTFAARVRRKGLRVEPTGELFIELGLYLCRAGRHPDDVWDPPDRIIALTPPDGTGDWLELSRSFRMPDNVAALLLRVGGRRFRGSIWIGSPRLFHDGGDTVIPAFEPSNEHWTQMNWLGENLSRTEWSKFTVLLDNRPAARPAAFSRILRRDDWETALPAADPGRHRLRLTLDAASIRPFVVQRVEVLEESARPLEIVATPEYAAEGQPFAILAERNAGARSRLRAVVIRPDDLGPDGAFTVRADRLTVRCRVRRVVRRGYGHDISLSTGDAVYLPQEADALTRFVRWYAANRLGNAICFRSVYQWSGSRAMQPAAWRAVIPLVNALGLRYHYMVDGRNLPDRGINPPDDLLHGPGYEGRQDHEHDGAFYYWGSRETAGLFRDIFMRPHPHGAPLKVRPAVRLPGDRVRPFFDAHAASDMREGAALFVANVARSRMGATRHTGPSTLFRYFLKAGYDWVGAEQMYGPEEVTLAALRGACRAARQRAYGAHLAMQWSSAPQNTVAHADRYFLSLALCYLHGVTGINLEEGLWRMESEFAEEDRFGPGCRRHLAVHTRFRRFCETRPRRGRLCVPLAVLQGRYCSWGCINRMPAWSSERPEFAFGAPERSFDLLKIFYPRSVLDAIYCSPCRDDRPEGWYSGTPFGPADLLPLEAPADVLAEYSALAFLGWNTFDESEFRRLAAFVRQGGRLLLARPHLSVEVRRGVPSALPSRSAALAELLGEDRSACSQPVRRRVGRGEVTYFPRDQYPANESVRGDYEKALTRLGEWTAATQRRRGWLRGNQDVGFVAYDREDGLRDIHALNIAWWDRARPAPARLLFGASEPALRVPFGRIVTLTLGRDAAVQPAADDMDVLAIAETGDGATVTVQSDAGGRLDVFWRDGRRQRVAVPGGGIRTVCIPTAPARRGS